MVSYGGGGGGGLISQVVSCRGGLISQVVSHGGGLISQVVSHGGGLISQVVSHGGGLIKQGPLYFVKYMYMEYNMAVDWHQVLLIGCLSTSSETVSNIGGNIQESTNNEASGPLQQRSDLSQSIW